MDSRPAAAMPQWLPRIVLSPADQAALTTAARELASRFPTQRLSSPGLQAEALSLLRTRWPELRGLLDEVPASVDREGAVLVSGVPLAFDSLLATLCATLGVVTPEGNGPPGTPGMLIYDVAPSTDSDELSKTYDALELHTDSAFEPTPHAYMALGCLVADPSGGGRSLLVRVDDAVAILRELGEDEVVGRLEDKVFPLELTAAQQDSALQEVAVLERAGSGYTVRWRADMLHAGLQATARQLAAPYRRAIDRFVWVISGLADRASFALLPGDLLLFDNRRMLHGRTPIGSGVTRRLKRLKMHAVRR